MSSSSRKLKFQAKANTDQKATIELIETRLRATEHHISALQRQNQRLTSENTELKHQLADIEKRLNDVTKKNQEQEGNQHDRHAMRNVTGSDLTPVTRSQFSNFSQTDNPLAISCPNDREIFITSALYGQFWNQEECGTNEPACTVPNPEHDCTQPVEENSEQNWLEIKSLCDYQPACQIPNPDVVIESCDVDDPDAEDPDSDYMQVFYSCLPDDVTGPVAFTAYATTGSPTDYRDGDVILFNEILTNLGGHYNSNMGVFVCPVDGVYLMSVNLNVYWETFMYLDLMRNSEQLSDVYIENIPETHNRGSTSVVVRCDRGDILWVRAGNGAINASENYKYNTLTIFLIYRY